MANPGGSSSRSEVDDMNIGSAPVQRTLPGGDEERPRSLVDPERERLMWRFRPEEAWRYSRSSMSSMYHSAQDMSDLLSDGTSEIFFDPPQSPHLSFRSFRDPSTFENEDIFSSPPTSPVHGKKGKSVAFQEIMAIEEVDFVLVWEGPKDDEYNPRTAAGRKRAAFEGNLKSEGLRLESERVESNNFNFVKIHASEEVLRRYAEILKLRMPLGKAFQQQAVAATQNALITEMASLWTYFTDYFKVDPRKFPEKNQRFNAVYTREKEYLFDAEDHDFFNPQIKARIVDFILKQTRYITGDDKPDEFAFGIQRLINEGVYKAAYPLHDGDLKKQSDKVSQRYLLWTEWAAVGKGLKYQPLDAVKDYFGVKIGLYFAWLGFYTNMLIPVAILGWICFLYGAGTLYENTLSEDICKADDVHMCPLCEEFCNYWKLSDTCFYARFTYFFDNSATVVFAAVMSLWSAIFLENWKRYAAEIKHRWDLTNFDVYEEPRRPEYLARLRTSGKVRINGSNRNGREESHHAADEDGDPYVPFWKVRIPYTLFSVSMILFLILLAVAAVVGVVIYRLAFMAALIPTSQDYPSIHSWGLILVNGTAASINLIFIFFFNWLYGSVAEYLTEMEFHRTQTSFDDSLTLKMYLLQFINYYSSIFYVAFLKGKFTGSPRKPTKIFGFRQEECAPGGCMAELCIQLAIIMVGKQAMGSIMEMLWPLVWKKVEQVKIMTGIKTEEETEVFKQQWAKDVKLLDWGPRALFPEYLEMVLQYGFVTIFVAAFPLAPFFALLNNILEMRLDAKKLITYYRRPVSQRVKDIGIWYGILDGVGKLAVISNAFIIAFTSNFIPKLVYMYTVSKDRSLDGYLDHSLARFNTSHFDGQGPRNSTEDVGVCRYQQYRDTNYERTAFYWKVWMARLAFVVVFENVVAVLVMLLKWLIPDIPQKIQDEIRRENTLINTIIIKEERYRAKKRASGDFKGSKQWSSFGGREFGDEIELQDMSTKDSNSLRRKKNCPGGDAEVMV